MYGGVAGEERRLSPLCRLRRPVAARETRRQLPGEDPLDSSLVAAATHGERPTFRMTLFWLYRHGKRILWAGADEIWDAAIYKQTGKAEISELENKPPTYLEPSSSEQQGGFCCPRWSCFGGCKRRWSVSQNSAVAVDHRAGAAAKCIAAKRDACEPAAFCGESCTPASDQHHQRSHRQHGLADPIAAWVFAGECSRCANENGDPSTQP